MDDEKFKLNKSNIIFMVIDIVLFILVVISFIFLAKSFGEESLLPDLEITQDRTSTKSPRTTTTSTTTTTVPATKKSLNSPYYNLDPNTLLTSELLTKKELSKDEAMEVMTLLYETGSKVFNTTDNSLLDIATTIEYAKEGEIDKVVIDDVNYGIVYNGNDLLKKLFTNSYLYALNNQRIKGKSVFKVKNNNYYRMENKLSDVELVIVNKNIDFYSTASITANITYYKSNYKEEGYTSPVYKKFIFEAFYEENRWKLSEFKFPLLD